jgi:hypothetical protein
MSQMADLSLVESGLDRAQGETATLHREGCEGWPGRGALDVGLVLIAEDEGVGKLLDGGLDLIAEDREDPGSLGSPAMFLAVPRGTGMDPLFSGRPSAVSIFTSHLVRRMGPVSSRHGFMFSSQPISFCETQASFVFPIMPPSLLQRGEISVSRADQRSTHRRGLHRCERH